MGSRSLLRRMNSLGALRAVISHPQTLRELASSSGLSRTAVDAVASDLVAMGWLTASDDTQVRTVGRPAMTYRVPADVGCLLSVDIGANHVFAVLTDLSGAVLGQSTAAVREDDAAADRIAATLTVCDDLLAAHGRDRSAPWIVVIGSPGAIGADGRVLHFGGTGMPGWIGLDLRERFAWEFEGAVLVEGDVPLGAHAELTFGAARGREDVVYVLCGRRTSGAAIVGGRVHRGVHGAAGTVGEIPELKWAELNEQYGRHALGTPRPSREQIFEMARSGDPSAIEAVTEFADDLAAGAAAMVLAIDPELLVIGGGSAPGADVFLDRFTETLGRICPLVPAVAVSALGSEAVALGGISLATRHLDAVLEEAVRTGDAFPDPSEARRLTRAAAA
ncbi:ROK family protein [Microbacterium jejuense]|uniref:ROK family protein n=1 Tax=Microbacterium jejuense TaxID=1263637 RepID=A0ABS7HIQ9_9MICO|nr:ROK family protein [Microbacterium jejuense]MBW9092797.1 ROK family protein [Microbacterium jejuense]